ncbi:MAG: hypothetical protein WAT89_11440 [Candidatus Kapaibacterium sp.]
MSSDRYLSTHNTNLSINYLSSDTNSFNNYNIKLNYLTSATLQGSYTNKDQLDFIFQNIVSKPLKNVRFISSFECTLNNESQKFNDINGINNNYNIFLGSGGLYNSNDSNIINLQIGVVSNKQLNVINTGAGITSDIRYYGSLYDYNISLLLLSRFYNISPKLNTTFQLYFNTLKDYSEGSSISFGIDIEHFGFDTYVKRKEEDIIKYGGLNYDALQNKTDNKFKAYTDLNYFVSPNWKISVFSLLKFKNYINNETSNGLPPLSRDLDPYKQQRKEFGLNFTCLNDIKFNDLFFSASINYGNNSQTNSIEPIKTVSDFELNLKKENAFNSDFISRNLSLNFYTILLFSSKDSLTIGTVVSMFRYDTPFNKNNNEKDEQQINAFLNYSLKYNDFLDIGFSLQTYLTHLVYLYSDFSSDNNRNKVFKISQFLKFNLNNDFINWFASDISTNYTEYDYKILLQGERGRSFRELHINDSLHLNFKNNLSLYGSVDFRYSIRGIFNWDNFSESPIDINKTYGFEFEFSKMYYNKIQFNAGFRYINFNSYKKDSRNIIVPNNQNSSLGPLAKVIFTLSDLSKIIFTGWIENKYSTGNYYLQPWLNISVKLNL